MSGIEFGMAGLPVVPAEATRTVPNLKYAVGWYYSATLLNGTSNNAYTQNTLYAVNGWITQQIIIDRLGVLAIGVASASIRLGVYDDLNGLPGTLIVDAGSVDGTGTAVVEAAIQAVLPRGQIWLAWAPQGANANIRSTSTGSGSNISGFIPNSVAQMQNVAALSSSVTVSGELPTSFGSQLGLTAYSAAAHIGFRVAEVF